MRERLPDDREGLTHHFEIVDANNEATDGYVQTGMYEDGRLGEIFVKVGKQGNIHAMFDQWAISTSVALQHGALVDDLFRKFVGTKFPPYGSTSNKTILRCTSPLDYIGRYILSRYGTGGELPPLGYERSA